MVNCNFMYRLWALNIAILTIFSTSAQNHSINGYVTDQQSGEALIGAAIYGAGIQIGTVTNVYGFYSLELPQGHLSIVYSFIGFAADTLPIHLDGDTTINADLSPSSTLLSMFEIVAEKSLEDTVITASAPVSIHSVEMNEVSSIPSMGGEVDILKVMQLMPGVKRGVEGSTSMYVRGGNGDQNLILLDEATVYNASHLFGFFSVFNPDAINNITLMKAGFPASYGGRLSSVMDVHMKEGNLKRYSAAGGISLLSMRATVQGPIVKDKASFIVSGRRTYIDQVFKLLFEDDPLPYYFYDVNAKVNYKVSKRDRIFMSVYSGDDLVRFKADFEDALFNFKFILGNFTSSVRWNHVYNSKLFSNVSLIHTRFRYNISGEFVENNIQVKSSIQDIGAKIRFEYSHNSKNQIRFGGEFVNHLFRPNVISTAGQISESYRSAEGQLISTQESAIYLLNYQSIGKRLKLNYGLRYSLVGTQDTIYQGPEPRLAATYRLNRTGFLKASYSRMRQNMHLVSSSSIALPVDLWYPVTKRVDPQISDQVALGFEWNFRKFNTSLVTEAYYKEMQNLIEYREGAVLLLNNNYESELIGGKGKAYGAEIMVKKNTGRITGWIAYTLSWTTRTFEALNDGETFFAKYDRRHDMAVVGNVKFNKQISLAIVWVYSTGARFTPLVGNFVMPNASMTNVDIYPIYAAKNSAQFPAAHRLDVNFIFKSKPGKRLQHELHIGGYNVYNRTQPFITQIVRNDEGTLEYQAQGLFGFIPSLAYNLKF